MSIRTALCSATLAISILILTDVAPSMAEAKGTTQQRNACMADAFRLCLSSIPNAARIESCLRANRRSLSSACWHEIYDDDTPPQKASKNVIQGSGHAPE